MPFTLRCHSGMFLARLLQPTYDKSTAGWSYGVASRNLNQRSKTWIPANNMPE